MAAGEPLTVDAKPAVEETAGPVEWTDASRGRHVSACGRAAVSTDRTATMAGMAIETPTGTRLAPELERPYWHDHEGERLTFQEVVSELAGGDAAAAADRHVEAICAVARAAAHARLRGEGQDARRLALAAGRLCEEIAGFWPRDSWKPIGKRLRKSRPAGDRRGEERAPLRAMGGRGPPGYPVNGTCPHD